LKRSHRVDKKSIENDIKIKVFWIIIYRYPGALSESNKAEHERVRPFMYRFNLHYFLASFLAAAAARLNPFAFHEPSFFLKSF